MLDSSQSSASPEVESARPRGAPICPEHKKLLADLVAHQREQKRLRDRLNRSTGPRHNAEMAKINHDIRWRGCVIWQARFRVSGCSVCRLIKSFGYNVLKSCLPSSTVEHLICNQDVVGSIPAGGSKPLLVGREQVDVKTQADGG